MDAINDLGGEWFEQGESLANSAEEHVEEAPRPNLLARFGLAFAGAGTFLVLVLGIVRAMA
jgi:3-oxoacyl-(acyl-carrier-protein) synthase